MYSPNLRSYIRSYLRQTAQNYIGPLDPAAIAKDVTENIMAKFAYTNEDWKEAVYQIVYDEACEIFKAKKKEIQLDLPYLQGLGVPPKHCALIIQLKQGRLYVPSAGGYMDLVGDQRVSRAQLLEAKNHLENATHDLAEKTKLVEKLWKLPGYYQ